MFFVTPEIGWIASGAAGNELYRTTDGGHTWTAQAVVSQSGQHGFYRLPAFDNAQNGILPVVVAREKDRVVQFYTTSDGGNSWALMAETPLDQNIDPQTSLPLSLLSADSWLMISPNTNQLLRTTSLDRSLDDRTARIQTLKMVSSDTGWGKYATGGCSTSVRGDTECRSETSLLRTNDGGQTWTSVNLPQTDGTTVDKLLVTYPGESPTSRSTRSQQIQGQGFDKCEIATLSQLQTWKSSSPYSSVNLYIGGSSRACSNSALTSSYVTQMSQQGWTFIPTWVGPQAPCSGYSSRLSYDVATAYNQGVIEANSASSVASNLGLAAGGGIIYYDAASIRGK